MGNSISSTPFTSSSVRVRSSPSGKCHSSAPTLPIGNNCPGYRHKKRDAETAKLSHWIYSPQDDLPSGTTLAHIEHKSEENPVQWAMVKTLDTLYVVFKGTDDLQDVLIDIAGSPFDWKYESTNSLGVHGGMWAALHTHGVMTTDQIAAEQNSLSHSQLKIVLCGHSLGGGYAILCGLELLHIGIKNIDAIIAHGAPQVIIPDSKSKLWNDLSGITTVYINGFDAVPRLPSCSEEWKGILSNLLPAFTREMSGSIEVQCDGLLDRLGVWTVLCGMKGFRHVGKIMFVTTDGDGHKSMLVEANEPIGWELLKSPPDNSGRFIILHHKQYPDVLASLLNGDRSDLM